MVIWEKWVPTFSHLGKVGSYIFSFVGSHFVTQFFDPKLRRRSLRGILLLLDSHFLLVVGDVRQRGRTRAGAEGRVQGCQRGDGRDNFLRGSSEDGAAAVVRVRGWRRRRKEARVQAPETQQRYCTSIAMSFWGYIIIMYQQYCLS